MKLFLSLLFLFTFVLPQPLHAQDNLPNWHMAGANAQRTSWVAAEVNPQQADSFGVLWYRPIEAYIGQHVQLTTGYGNIYVATARGLYALNANTGEVTWRYDTELPLGHSPTVVDGMAFVGGLDRRVYALDAQTGQLRWQFEGAQAGFTTSPLVVEGMVLLGGRDGYFYALDQQKGQLRWQYPSAAQPPLGPILYSAAYADGLVYFAANDNHAYALDVATGALHWRSQLLPGDGYQAWWPVIYGNMVVFSGAVGYRNRADVGSNAVADVMPADSVYQVTDIGLNDFIYGIQRDDLFYPGFKEPQLLGEQRAASNNPAWPDGAIEVDAGRATEYWEDDGAIRFDRPTNKPWRRTTIMLDAVTGAEITLDTDGDGNPEYAPFLSVGTKSGNQYPPLLMPDQSGTPNQVLYKLNFAEYQPEWNISRGAVMGWQPDAPRTLRLTNAEFAIDEPVALSGAGNLLFTNLCCDRVAGWLNLNTGKRGEFWNYHQTLESLTLHLAHNPDKVQPWQRSLAPGYDQMWWDSSMWLGLPRLYGGYGGPNAAYHNHGLQNPLVPYDGKLFTHRSNAIIALGPNPSTLPADVELKSTQDQNYTPTAAEHQAYESALAAQKMRPLLPFDHARQDSLAPVTAAELTGRLENEVRKMVEAGHLRPGYYAIGQTGYPQLHDYFANPGDTLLTLSLAYPHLSPDLQAQLQPYLQAEYEHYFAETLYTHTGWWEEPVDPAFGQLVGRESMPLPPEVAAALRLHPKSTDPGPDTPWAYPPQNIYALWKYAELFPERASAIYAKLKVENKLPLLAATAGGPSLPDDAWLADNPWEHNAYIAGDIGFLKLQELAGQAAADAALRQTVGGELQRLLQLRVANFSKDQPWVAERLQKGSWIHRRDMSIARNFLHLTPELATYLRQHALPQMQEAVAEYSWVAPYWFVTRYEASVSEGVQRHLLDSPALFQAKARILYEPQQELVKYLDVPAFAVGDLFYMQNLVAALEAAPAEFCVAYGEFALCIPYM
ncbi:MAG: PQQ-like beta-propeller repeat protein [Caldilineaceae bacterium]|nr:PQQ-like beta-propeller repeat protein [Caldilineaceae bacterium]